MQTMRKNLYPHAYPWYRKIKFLHVNL